jgi:cytochrome b pre-mRNA-processing protein 3
MPLLSRIFGERSGRAALEPLYRAVVAAARDPAWYRGGVPDTMDGRFDMVAAVLALVLLRMEAEPGPADSRSQVLLTEAFIDDMDGTLRQIGIGDHVVGKHVGRMMSALGGRLAAFREASDGPAFEAAVRLNVFHDAPPSEEAVALVAARLIRLRCALADARISALLDGKLPSP